MNRGIITNHSFLILILTFFFFLHGTKMLIKGLYALNENTVNTLIDSSYFNVNVFILTWQ